MELSNNSNEQAYLDAERELEEKSIMEEINAMVEGYVENEYR
jgi:hypothetical protein